MATATKLPRSTNGQKLTSAMSGKSVLAGIPMQSEYCPRSPEEACTLLLAMRGQFKSSFCLSNPHALVLDFEDGCRAVMNRKGKVVPIVPSADSDVPGEWLTLTPWERYEKVRNGLLEAAKTGQRPCKTVVFDTLDAMMDMILRKFCKDHNIESPGDYDPWPRGAKGWYAVRDMFMAEFYALRAAGYGVWMPAHLRSRFVVRNGEEHIYFEPWVQESLRGILFREVDQIYHLEMCTLTDTNKVEKKVAGKVISVPEKSVRTVLRMRTVPRSKNTEVKTRVYIPDMLELPLDDPFGEYAKVYWEEVNRVKNLQS